MALQQMQPRQFDFDPRLYQYGGGYIYLIAGTLGATSFAGLTELTSDVGVYLEQPELFAHFYVVSRVVVLVFGGLLLVAVWKLARRAAGHTAAWLALLLVACTPVFITGVLEAKPHVPSACLALWAVLSALDYHAGGRRCDALRMGLQAGYAFGCVLTGIVAAALWPVLLIARWRASGRAREARRSMLVHLALAAGLMAGVYLLTNPYVPYNYLFRRGALASNIDNSTAMYADQMRQSPAGAVRVGELLLESCGPGVIVVGLIGFAWLLRRRPQETLVAAASGLAMLLICVILGAGKPAEYARFLILPVSLLCVAGGGLLGGMARRRRVWALLVGAVALLLMNTPTYVRSFVVDAKGMHESRLAAGQYLRDRAHATDAIGLLQEPAPYAVPPMDFTRRKIVWLPSTEPTEFDRRELPMWLVFAADDGGVHHGAWWERYYQRVARFPSSGTGLSRIAWADKPVFVYLRCDAPRLYEVLRGE